MGVEPNWTLLGKNNALAAFEKGAQIGDTIRQRNEKRDRHKAIAAAVTNPDDPKALNALIALDPELGMKFETRNRDNRYRDAQTEYFTPQNALASPPQAVGPAGVPASPNPAVGMNQPAPKALVMPGAGSAPATQVPPAPQAAPDQPDEFHTAMTGMFGAPKDGRDKAFLKMLRANPEKAWEFRTGMRDKVLKSLKTETEAYEMAASQLGGVTDEASYQAVLGDFAGRLEPLGVDVRSKLPPNYPGPEGIRKLLTSALSAKEQLSQLIARDRLDAYVGDIDADNERADRNTDSLIDDRQARTGIARGRAAETVRNNRSRNRRGGRGQGKAARPTATGPNGDKVEWNGKDWVPVAA